MISIAITETDIKEIVASASGGDALGEHPINTDLAIAVVAAHAQHLTATIVEHLEQEIEMLIDHHARVPQS